MRSFPDTTMRSKLPGLVDRSRLYALAPSYAYRIVDPHLGSQVWPEVLRADAASG